MRCFILIFTTFPYSYIAFSSFSFSLFTILHPLPSPSFHPFLSSYLAVLPVRDLVRLSSTHWICNSFLYPSYRVSFEPVSQGVCQIWTLCFTVFFPFLHVCWMNSERVTDTQKGQLSPACFPPHNAWKTAAVSHIHTLKYLVILPWDGIWKIFSQDVCNICTFLWYTLTL